MRLQVRAFTLRPGFDPNDFNNEQSPQSLTTALMFCAMGGHVDLIDMLLKKGAKVDRLDLQRRSALHYASWHGRHQAAARLLEAGANPNLVDRQGCTPLHLACEARPPPRGRHTYSAAEAVTLLLRHGATQLIARFTDHCSPSDLAAAAETAEGGEIVEVRGGAEDVARTRTRGAVTHSSPHMS
jgi:hypothetical protein